MVALLLGAYFCIRRHRRNKMSSQSTTTYSNGVQQYPHPFPQSPHSAYLQSPAYQTPISPSHLQPAPVAELSGNTNSPPLMQDAAPKYDSPVVQDSSYILHGDWQPSTPVTPHAQPLHTPTSPHPSAYSTTTRSELSGSNPNVSYGSQTSPTPTNASLGRSPPRRP